MELDEKKKVIARMRQGKADTELLAFTEGYLVNVTDDEIEHYLKFSAKELIDMFENQMKETEEGPKPKPTETTIIKSEKGEEDWKERKDAAHAETEEIKHLPAVVDEQLPLQVAMGKEMDPMEYYKGLEQALDPSIIDGVRNIRRKIISSLELSMYYTINTKRGKQTTITKDGAYFICERTRTMEIPGSQAIRQIENGYEALTAVIDPTRRISVAIGRVRRTEAGKASMEEEELIATARTRAFKNCIKKHWRLWNLQWAVKEGLIKENLL